MKNNNLDFIKAEEQFLIWLMGHITDTFGPKAILRGGMILRLLDSPRPTHDLDYSFTGYDSKKEIIKPIIDSLKPYNQIKVTYKLHSTNAHFDLKLDNKNGQFHIVLEVNIIDNCETTVISTGQTSKEYLLEPKLILTMKPEIALANKLAACIERSLIRDLYDAYYFYRFMSIFPDITTLSQRLKKLNYIDKKLRKTCPKTLSIKEFCDLLSKKSLSLDEKSIKEGLPTLSPSLLPGLHLKIRSALLELGDWIRDNSQ